MTGMRVHHLVASRFRITGVGRLIAHVLLVESPDGLVLVDSGFGRADQALLRRFGPLAAAVVGLDTDPAVTAIGQVERLGFDPADVKHIVLTHLDFDHVGGVSDFPRAVMHTTSREWHAATASTSPLDRARYLRKPWAADQEVRQHDGPCPLWRHGLSGHRVVDGVTLLPLIGHTLGHAAVAVEGENGFVVHAGDAVFDGSTINATDAAGEPLTSLPRMRAFERLVARQPRTIRANHRTLSDLNGDPDVTVISAHDARQFPG
jgi:glyoxylase-like metal-dependent hydrolase (beta-lactamase superfamily II)